MDFAPAVTADAGQGIRNLELADINGDGRDDIISKNNLTSAASVMLSAGGGAFGPATIYSNLGNGTGIQLADINYDGIKDLITIGANIVHILAGTGDGAFTPHSTLTATGGQHTVVVTDTDGDGILDIGFSGGAVKVYKGNGDGSFQNLSTFNAVANNSALVFGDLNGDGAKDVLVRSPSVSDIMFALATPQITTTIERIDLTSRAAALEALTTIERAFNRVSGERGAIGAVQSRIESAISTLTASRENSLAAQGRITDTDVASEAAAMTKNRILMQTAASVLAQANQLPSLALILLAD